MLGRHFGLAATGYKFTVVFQSVYSTTCRPFHVVKTLLWPLTFGLNLSWTWPTFMAEVYVTTWTNLFLLFIGEERTNMAASSGCKYFYCISADVTISRSPHKVFVCTLSVLLLQLAFLLIVPFIIWRSHVCAKKMEQDLYFHFSCVSRLGVDSASCCHMTGFTKKNKWTRCLY